EDLVQGVKGQLLVLFGAVGLVLLIAAANVANLLLARGLSRRQEISMRLALGATPLRIVRQLLTENLLMGLLAGVVGLVLAGWTTHLLRPWIAVLLTDQSPIASSGAVLGDIHLDGWSLVFTLVVSLAAGLLSGLAPASQRVRTSLYATLKEANRSLTTSVKQSRLRSLLVVSEVALAVVLVIGAGLLFKSYVRLRNVEPGFQTDHLLCFAIDLSHSQYADAGAQAGYFERAISRIQAIPGVQSVAANSMLPFMPAGEPFFIKTEIDGTSGATGDAFQPFVSPDYFRTLGIPLLRGRYFTDQDRAGAPEVVIVSESFARRHFPNEDPIGKRLRNPNGNSGWQTIVGVVGNVHQFDLNESWEENKQPQIYQCYLQSGVPVMCLAVKTACRPAELEMAVRRCVAGIDQGEPIYSLTTLEQRLEQTLAPRRCYLLVLGIFAGLAFGLAAVGIYGVISCLVAQRSHEFGVRMALGASRQAIVRLVLKQGLRLGLAGITVGCLAAIALTRLIASELYGVPAIDPSTFVCVALLLLSVALLACWVPACRATKADPITALRCD
ncbi:MAG TPA: FtsX-like permease family protein, partial [Clostridia bacterium]|nr:FtsX-like permease family protein [Clostridia bacterium]